MSQRWLAKALARIHRLASQGKVRFTLKALRELAALDMGLDEEDACHVLAHMKVGDFAERALSRKTDEWMCVFKPRVAGVMVYVKLVIRGECVVISFHEEEGESNEDD